MYTRNVFIIASNDSYEFLEDHLDDIIYSYNLENCNIIMPFEYSTRDYITMNIERNSHKYLIESHEYVKNLDNYNYLSNGEIQDLRIIESKKRSYKEWLKQKLNYSKNKILTADTCIIIHNNNINHIIQKELRDEMNIAKQLKKQMFNIEQEKFNSLHEKIKILKQKWNK